MDKSQIKYLNRHTKKYMDQLTEQQKQDKLAFEKSLDEIHTVDFKKRELLFIVQVLTKIQFVYGDFLNAQPIIQKLEPLVVIEPKEGVTV